MHLHDSRLLLSATDLAGHLACPHLTQLERRRAAGEIEPPLWQDPMADVLRERGQAHEKAYLDHLAETEGLEIVRFVPGPMAAGDLQRTKDAMARGAGAIAQAPLLDGRWRGRADVLKRIERRSDLGGWSYVVADTKLAAETRGGTILQLCLYSEIVGKLQGRLPDEMLVVAPGGYADPERHRTRDFSAYYRLVRARLETAVAGLLPTYPEPVDQCEICRWWSGCDARRRRDDHLSFVAGVSRLQRRELEPRGISTLTQLARARMPLDPRPSRGSPETYEKAHHQARIQLASRGEERPLVEPLEPAEPGMGLARLPEPSRGDVFLDLEGDPFVEHGGLEYLFGWVAVDDPARPAYRGRWALDREEEKAAFEEVMDVLAERWETYPDFHVYHFHSYEPSAFKRLMGRHATREEELDRLLRGGRFVDLHAVVRQGLRIGVETYGLKQLEEVHGFARELDLRDASLHKNDFERWLETGGASENRAPVAASRAAVEIYNRDDCVSTWKLRDWLEGIRADRNAAGAAIPRPEAREGEASEDLSDELRRLRALAAELTAGVPADPGDRSDEQRARRLLAHLLEWHRREDKASWWEYFRLADLPPEDLLEEKHGLHGLEFLEEVGGTAKCPVHRYRFPVQDHDVRDGQTLHVDAETKLGVTEEIDLGAGTIDVKKRSAARDLHPAAVFAHDHVKAMPLPQALERLAVWVAANGADAPGAFRAGRDLLLKRPPRLADGDGRRAVTADRASGADPLVLPGEDPLDAALRLALSLDRGVLPIQGPPGTGKSYAGARMIRELVKAGRKVGITAVSHKVIRNLLDKVHEACEESGLDLACIQKVGTLHEETPGWLTETAKNEDVDRALASGDARVGAGTVWAWAREAAFETLDVLVIDEAGQMSLANALAASQAARNVVLLGDPRQLEQPMQGSHPEGCDASALDHLLEDHETIPGDRGLFLPETWRLHPSICELTSELFYDGRLKAREGLERQGIVRTPGTRGGRSRSAGSGAPGASGAGAATQVSAAAAQIAGAGLWLAPVEHQGNQTSSPEEADRVAALLGELTSPGVEWIDPEGRKRPLTLDGILVVSPFNAQVAALRAGLPEGARVGTVDRFQGQEAPVVIYSMASSTAEEAPRGMEFLYSLNRFNVATSRARCAVIVVASPALFTAECRTPLRMKLVNALCRFRELAGVV